MALVFAIPGNKGAINSDTLPNSRLLLRCAEGGWLPPQADVAALHEAAGKGHLATLTRLASEGVNLDAKGNVSAAPPVAPCPLRLANALAAPANPAAQPSPPPLTACGAAAAPP